MGKNRHFQALFCTKYPLKPPKKYHYFGHEINFMTKIREKSCAETGEHSTTPALQLHNRQDGHHHRRRPRRAQRHHCTLSCIKGVRGKMPVGS